MDENRQNRDPVGRVPSPGVSLDALIKPATPPRRLRRLHRVWPDRDGNISYLLTACVDRRARVLNREEIFQRFATFLIDSPARYHWFGRRFVIMPDHFHLIAHMGHGAVTVGEWMKALKAILAGVARRTPGEGTRPTTGMPPGEGAKPGEVFDSRTASAGHTKLSHEFTRIKRTWRWQDGYHDHKFRTPESESRKWEYVCLNPVRYGLVQRPEEWPFGGEIFYDHAGGPQLIRGTPPLLETGLLIEEEPVSRHDAVSPGEGTRPTT